MDVEQGALFPKFLSKTRRSALNAGRIALISIVATSAAVSCDVFSNPDYLFSSSTSPDGSWIAENFARSDPFAGGYVSIRKTSERVARGHPEVSSSETQPGLFMIWSDDNHLVLMRDAGGPPLNGPSEYRGIALSYSTYEFPKNDIETYNRATGGVTDVTVAPENSSASLKTEARRGIAASGTGTKANYTVCTLTLTANDSQIYDKVGVDIVSSDRQCRVPDCGGFSTRFWLGKPVDARHRATLTSATISDIPSYNRLPDGDRNSSLRGQFLGENARELISELTSSTEVRVRYSLDFFDRILSYKISMAGIRPAVDAFLACPGDPGVNRFEQQQEKTTAPSRGD